MKRPPRTARLALAVTACVVVLAACGGSSDKSTTTTAKKAATATSGKLTGTFKITAADCTAGAPISGSYFRMVQSGGTLTAGPFVPNADSPCGDKNYTGVSPGTDGGLENGKLQPQPADPFDAAKNGLADAITQPSKFFAVGFALSTNPKDPTTGAALQAPEITADASGNLSGQIRALNVAWNGQQFSQGSPKPDGSRPGITSDPKGTYDAKTGKYTLEWASQVVGGPFNGFTGSWHLEGTFEKD